MQRLVVQPLVVVQIHNAVMIIQSVYLAPIQVDFAKDRIHVVQVDKSVQAMARRVQFARVAHKVVAMGVIQVVLKYVVPTIKQFVIAIKHVVAVIVAMLVRHV